MHTPDWFSILLQRELAQGVSLTDLQVAQLHQHYELLLAWNQRMNLTSVKPGTETVVRHYCESLFFAAHIPNQGGDNSVLDLGSGPGFPGIPMAILKPKWRVTLVESNQKKAVFLRESARNLKNVSVYAERAENVLIPADWTVARAVEPAEVVSNGIRLSSKVGLMLGEADFLSLQRDSRIAWADPVRLPWGDRRLCVYGNVPRET